ncbi:hypothetical protein [Nocardiopsis tropica]|uniref:Uncharacterized protein n=1 Tax=Nocardiopsis tropica TaxID=109330 RepID=A0ABU7KQW6_9ACTN|nr:hypothetical protein [Nocardiopsis umidischolae]MEE2051683.1 hypothetical protein [Nocardiopsis umidischolae]
MTLIEDRYYLPAEVPDVEVKCVVEVTRLGYPDECGALCDDGPICGAHMLDVDAGAIPYEAYRRYLAHAQM